MPRFAKAILCALSPVLVAACGADAAMGSPASASSPTKPAGASDDSVTSKAYAALTAGAQDQVTQLIADVDDAVAKNPSDGRAMLYSAIMRFWQLGEEIDLPPTSAEELTLVKTMIDRFRKAQSMLPNDDRAPAFGGLAKVIIGKATSDSSMQAEGLSDIDHGIQIFPVYSNFLRALASAESPPGSDDFAAVMPHLQAAVDDCGVQDSAGKFKYIDGPLPAEQRACNDVGIVPHVWEGFFINYGDLLLKAGKGADAARAAYEGVKLAPRFDKWPFASALQDRIDHVADRAALYADSDPSNDPKIWMQDGHICTGCHQDTR
jgi:hypothetical protein